jgi:preprotein translocase subunit SecF
MRIFTNANYNFIRWRWHAVALSTIVLAAGIATMMVRGVPLGIDFTGGTILVLQFQQPVTEDQVRTALATLPGDKVVQRYGDGDANELLIRLPQVDVEREDALEEGGRQALALIEQANLGPYEMLSLESVGPVIGRDLQRRASGRRSSRCSGSRSTSRCAFGRASRRAPSWPRRTTSSSPSRS